MEPIDLTASSDDEPASGHDRHKEPNGFPNRNAGSTPTDMVDLTIDEPDYDPYLMSGTLSSPMPQIQQNPHTVPPSVSRKQEPSAVHPNGIPLQTHVETATYTPEVSNINFRANGLTWTPAPAGPCRPLVAPGLSMAVDFNAGFTAGSLGQSSGVRMPIDLAAPIEQMHLGPTTPAYNEATVIRRSEPVVPMHPYHQSPSPAPITTINSKFRDRSQLHAPSAQNSKKQSPLPNANPSPSGQAVTDPMSNSNTQLGGSGQPVELPLTIDFFQECLQKAIRDLRNDHQYYVKVKYVPYWIVLLADQRTSHFCLAPAIIIPNLLWFLMRSHRAYMAAQRRRQGSPSAFGKRLLLLPI